MAQGFFYGPLGADDDFDAQQKELERRRKTASALDMQIGQAPPANASTKYKIGALIGNALSGGVAGMQEAELNKQSEDYSKRRQDFTRSWLDAMPRGTPEQPAIEPDPLGNEGLGTGRPMIPRAFPSRDEMTAWQGKGLPLGADADRLGTQAVSGMALDQERAQRGEDRDLQRVQTATMAREAAANREYENQLNRNQRTYTEEIRLADKAQARAEAQSQQTMIREMILAGKAKPDVAPAAVHFGYNSDGKKVVTTKDGGEFTASTRPDGSVALAPFDGIAVPKSTVEKELVKLAPLMMTVAQADKLLTVVDTNKAAFSPKSRMSTLPLVGPMLSAEAYTKEELSAQARVNKDAAEVINRLYGAAVTAGEEKRASKFIYNPDDNPQTLAAKLRAAKEWAAEHQQQYSDAARSIAKQRLGELSRPPLSGY